jgi:hypothetical protein
MTDDYVMIHAKVPFGLRTLFGMKALWVDLTYDTRDPYAVRFAPRRSSNAKPWLFSRELLSQGLFTRAGEGDVRLKPSTDTVSVVIELSSPEGFAALETCTAEIATFLERTYAVVPLGDENRWIDFERELAALG